MENIGHFRSCRSFLVLLRDASPFAQKAMRASSGAVSTLARKKPAKTAKPTGRRGAARLPAMLRPVYKRAARRTKPQGAFATV
jgi:hypothetical protein